jgi:hypothetical protein
MAFNHDLLQHSIFDHGNTGLLGSDVDEDLLGHIELERLEEPVYP